MEYIRFEGRDWVEIRNEKLMLNGLDWKERMERCRIERIVVGASRREWYLRHASTGEAAADESGESAEQETNGADLNLDKHVSEMVQDNPVTLRQRQSEARVIVQDASMKPTMEQLRQDAMPAFEDEFEALRDMEEEWYAEHAREMEELWEIDREMEVEEELRRIEEGEELSDEDDWGV
jgi:hypothetical protein